MAQTRPNRSVIDVDCEMLHPILSVPDVDAAARFYTDKLGFWLAFTEGNPARFAGLNLGRVQLFLELGTPCPEGCSVYFVVSDVDRLFQFHCTTAAETLDAPEVRSYGLRDYTV